MVTFSQMASVAGAPAGNTDSTISNKAEFGASLISKTLDNLNSKKKPDKGVSISYETQKDILNAGLAAKGVAISTTG